MLSAVRSERINMEEQLLECDRLCGELEEMLADEDVLFVPHVRSSEDERASGLGLVLKEVSGKVVVGDTVPGGDRSCAHKRTLCVHVCAALQAVRRITNALVFWHARSCLQQSGSGPRRHDFEGRRAASVA